MKKTKFFFLTLLAGLLMSVSAGAVEVTKIATMQQLIAGCGNTTDQPTANTDYKTDVEGGGIYNFGAGQIFREITNSDVQTALSTTGNWVTVAAWVYGKPTRNGYNCIFGYGENGKGIKWCVKDDKKSLAVVTKWVAELSPQDVTVSSVTWSESDWNLLAFSIHISNTRTIDKVAYYLSPTDGKVWQKNVNSSWNDPSTKKFAIGSQNMGGADENFTGTMANVTVMTSSSRPNNPEIYGCIGAAPTYNGVTVTYNYTFGGSTVSSEKFDVQVGAARPTATLPYGCQADYSNVPETISAAATYDVPVSTTSAFPFQFSTDFASAKWYTIKMRNGYAGFDGTNFPETSLSSQPTEAKYLYAFQGNPFAIKAMIGNGKYVKNSGENNELSTADATGTGFGMIQNSTGVSFTIDGVMGTINDVNKKMGFWGSGAAYTDDGSILTIEATDRHVYQVVFSEGAPSAGGLTYNSATVYANSSFKAFSAAATLTTSEVTVVDIEGYDESVALSNNVFTVTYTAAKSAAWLALNNLITDAKAIPTPTGPWGTDPGYYNQEAVNALPGAIETAEGVLAAAGGDESYIAATNTLQTAINAAKIIVPVVGKTYQLISAFPTFETTHGAKMAIYNNEGTNLRWMTLNNNNRAFYWTVTAVDGNSVTFQSLKDGKYPSTFNTNDQPVPLTTDVTACTLASYGDGQFRITAGTSKASLHAGNHGNGKNNNGNVMIWDTDKDGCSAWYIHEAEVPAVANITYKVMEGGSQIWSTVVEGAIGQPFPAATAPNTFITLGGYPTGNVEGEGTYELTYTVDSRIPQTFAAAGDVTKYYALDIHGNMGDIPVYGSSDAANMNLRAKYNSEDPYARVADGGVNDYMGGAVENDRYAWAFIGDVFNGVKLYNKGRNEYCVFDGAVNGQRDSYPATFVAEASSASVFQFKAMAKDDMGTTFALKNESASNPLNYLNQNTTSISGWTSSDGGSGFRVYEITPATAADAVEYTFTAEYGTLIVPFYAEIPEDLEVYTCSALSGNVLTLTAETSMIKPGVPYIIKSEPTSEFVFLGGTKLTTPATTTVGLLTGVYASTALNDIISSVGENKQAYVLTQADRVVFQYLEGDYGTATIGANRCFITLDKPETPAEVKTTLFFDKETGINDVDVDADVDGKFLENGKIVIVKNNAKYNVAGQMVK